MLYPWRSTWIRLAAAAVGVVAAAILAVTVIAAPTAAHIALRTASAAAGSTVDGSGAGFSPAGTAVELHLDQLSGSRLWSGAPDRSGAIAFSFTVPAVSAGSHTIVATQSGRDGEPVAGTPATAPLQITPGAPSPTASQAGQPESSQQKQPDSQPHTQPQVPGAPSVTTVPVMPPAAPAVAPPPAGAPTAPPVVFTIPAHPATHLINPPPQVATLWRVGGAVPTSTTASAPVTAPAAPAPATSTGSRGTPSAVTLVALAALVMSAIVVIATTLQVRSAELTAPAAARAKPQRQPVRRRSATMRSPDLWSGSPARLR